MSSPMRMRTSGRSFPLTPEASSQSNPVPAGIPDVHTHEMMMCVRDTPVFSREHHSGRHADSGARAVGLMTVELLARLGWAAFSLASPEPAASSAQMSSPSDPPYTSVCPSQAWTLKEGEGTAHLNFLFPSAVPFSLFCFHLLL